MAAFTIEDIQDALDRPPGRRAIEPKLREGELRIVNYGDFVQPSSAYLHHGVGGFAVVYRVRDTATDKEVAFRCWKRSELPSGTKERSESLDRYLATNPSPYLVHQRFFPNALYIHGAYQPVILMDWVNGCSLQEAVCKACAVLIASRTQARTNSTSPPDAKGANPLLALAEAFEEMIITLQARNVAHGDLQHDNIIVRNDGSLGLVDYDSIFVPGMVGDEPCPVSGVEGYSHPDYVYDGVVRPSNPHMDTFSAVIISASLRILAEAPDLYGTNTSQNLLFSGDDIADPDGSLFVQKLRLEFSDEPVASLLTALTVMRQDRMQAQVPFTLRNRRLRGTPPPRFAAPAVLASPVMPTWQLFAPTEFALQSDGLE